MSPLAIVVAIAVVTWGAIWAVLGRTAWWVPAFAFSFLGGFVNVGFKIYPHEIGLGLSMIAVIPVIAAAPRRVAGRPPIDWAIYALIGYMVAHMAVSSYAAVATGMAGTGTIVRIYFNGLWALIFAGLFWAYGDLRHVKIALAMATVFCIVRVAFGVHAFDAPIAGTAPGNAFFFPQASAVPAGTDLRVSGPALMALLTIWFYRAGRFGRMFIWAGYVAAIGCTVVGGSRVAALSVFAIPVIWALVQRSRKGLVVDLAATGALLVAINVSPVFYQHLPEGARRSLSSFVVTRTVDERTVTASSNQWHLVLLETGRRRWTSAVTTFVFGANVEGWQPQYATLTSFDAMADVATRLAAYENAFFTVAVTLGAVGLLLFARVLFSLSRPFTRSIIVGGVRRPDDALALVAMQSLVIYVGLCWIAGGFPSGQILLAVVAAVAYWDRDRTPPAAV